MSETRKTLVERIAEDGITSTASYGVPEARIPDWARGSDAWTVTLKFGRRSLTVPYFMGVGHQGREPGVEDVLQSLLSDASGIENARGAFEDWASEYGYDMDSRSAEKAFRAVKTQTTKLHRFLGDRFDAYIWETDEG